MVKCIYCGVEFDEKIGCNPDDYGLHQIPEFSDTCPNCNFITSINRAMALIIKDPGSDAGFTNLFSKARKPTTLVVG